MRGTPLIPDEFDLVAGVDWNGAIRGNVSTLVACDVYGREVWNRSVVFDAACVASWFGRHVVILSNLPGEVALAADFDALEVAVRRDGVGEAKQTDCKSTEGIHDCS